MMMMMMSGELVDLWPAEPRLLHHHRWLLDLTATMKVKVRKMKRRIYYYI